MPLTLFFSSDLPDISDFSLDVTLYQCFLEEVRPIYVVLLFFYVVLADCLSTFYLSMCARSEEFLLDFFCIYSTLTKYVQVITF